MDHNLIPPGVPPEYHEQFLATLGLLRKAVGPGGIHKADEVIDAFNKWQAKFPDFPKHLVCVVRDAFAAGFASAIIYKMDRWDS